MSETPDEKTQALVREAATLFGKLFISRKDIKAVFRPDYQGKWHWTAVEEKFTMGDFKTHLTGEHCLGSYLLAADSTVTFMAFDFDLSKDSKALPVWDAADPDANLENKFGITLDWKDANLEKAFHDPADDAYRWSRIIMRDAVRAVVGAVRTQFGLTPLTVVSGGGCHVFVPFPEPVPAGDARAAGVSLITGLANFRKRNDIFFDYGVHNEISLEVFPKQSSLDGKTMGNLIRLPYGWHHEAAVRTYSFDPEAFATPTWDWKKISSLGSLRALAQAVGKA